MVVRHVNTTVDLARSEAKMQRDATLRVTRDRMSPGVVAPSLVSDSVV